MRKVKDLRDSKTNEKIYPKSHAKATYLSDGRTVEDAEKTLSDRLDDFNNTIFIELEDTYERVEDPALPVHVPVISELSFDSNNPVQSSVIAQAIEEAVQRGRELAKRDLYIAEGALYNDTDEHIVKDTPWKSYVDSAEYKAQWDLDIITGDVVMKELTYNGKTYDYVDDNGTWKIVVRVGDKLVWDDSKVIHKSKHYYLNGLGDITEEQIELIYRYKNIMDIALSSQLPGAAPVRILQYGVPKLRTLFRHSGGSRFIEEKQIPMYLITDSSDFETVIFGQRWNSNGSINNSIDTWYAFNSSYAEIITTCPKFRVFGGYVKTAYNIIHSTPNCTYIWFKGTKSFTLNASNISKKCMLFLINNWVIPSSTASSTGSYNITLSARAYERFSNDADIISALETKNAALSAKNYILNLITNS